LTDIVTGLEENLKNTKQLYARAYTKLIQKVKKLRQKLKDSKGKRKSTNVGCDSSEDLDDFDLEDLSKPMKFEEGAESHGRNEDPMGFDIPFTVDGAYTVKYTVEHIGTGGGSVCTASRKNVDETAAHTLVHIRDNPINALLENIKNKEIAKKSEAKKNKPQTQAQTMSCMKRYLINQDHWTASQLKGKSFEEILKLHRYAQWKINKFIPMHLEEESTRFKRGGSHLESNSSKKQKNICCRQRETRFERRRDSAYDANCSI
jgi:hypothetical protein